MIYTIDVIKLDRNRSLKKSIATKWPISNWFLYLWCLQPLNSWSFTLVYLLKRDIFQYQKGQFEMAWCVSVLHQNVWDRNLFTLKGNSDGNVSFVAIWLHNRKISIQECFTLITVNSNYHYGSDTILQGKERLNLCNYCKIAIICRLHIECPSSYSNVSIFLVVS